MSNKRTNNVNSRFSTRNQGYGQQNVQIRTQPTPAYKGNVENSVPELQQEATYPHGMHEISTIPTVLSTNNIPVPQVQPAEIVMQDDSKISPFKKFFSTKKKGVRRKEKKARQNRRLRKMLTPKTALMALNELKGHLSQYKVTGQGTTFTAEIHVNGVKYEGFGNSKIAAKNNASEKALRELIIQKMCKIPKKDVTVIVKKTADNGVVEDSKMSEDVEMKDADEDEDVPMLHLASFALHKLFSEWEAQGFQIPDFRITTGSISDHETSSIAGGETEKKVPQPRNELPPNADQMHPCMLLSMMRPTVQYVEFGSEGTPPNITHKVGVSIDDKEFIGNGKSKKQARKAVAIATCNALFKTAFVIDDAK